MKKKQAFTLIELLVVIAIIALLISILMPALGRARELAKQVQCAANLSGLAKAIAVYQNTYREMNPSVVSSEAVAKYKSFYNGLYAGGANNICWNDPQLKYRNGVVSHIGVDGGWKYPSVGGCLFLLVKHCDVAPEVFNCPSAEQAAELTLDLARNGDNTTWFSTANPLVQSWNDCYDFPWLNFLNYSYNDPFNQLLDSSASSSLAVLADMNPSYARPGYSAPWKNSFAKSESAFVSQFAVLAGYLQLFPTTTLTNTGVLTTSPVWDDADGKKWSANSYNHDSECQNVAFADSHVKKSTSPNVGLNKDNIYSRQGGGSTVQEAVQVGTWGGSGSLPYAGSSGREDSYLGN